MEYGVFTHYKTQLDLIDEGVPIELDIDPELQKKWWDKAGEGQKYIVASGFRAIYDRPIGPFFTHAYLRGETLHNDMCIPHNIHIAEKPKQFRFELARIIILEGPQVKIDDVLSLSAPKLRQLKIMDSDIELLEEAFQANPTFPKGCRLMTENSIVCRKL